MNSLRWSVCSLGSALVGIALSSTLQAQTPDVIYTWDQTFGESAGANVETWAFGFGAMNQSVALNNTTDGTLTIVENGVDDGTNNGIGADWAINESFNRVKERFNPRDGGGLDLFGLSAIEIEIGHNGTSTIPVQVFSFIGPPSTYTALNGGADIMVAPGMNTYNVSLAGLTSAQVSSLRSLGLNVRGHGADGNLTWQVNEIRSIGPAANSRLIADHDDNATDFDGVQSNFDDSAVIGRVNFGTKSQEGLSINGGRLQWQESAGGPGLAIEYGGCDNCYLAEDFAARPHDLNNYAFAKLEVSVQSQVAGEPIAVQFYQQNLGYTYHAAPDQSIPADGQIHTLLFPTAGIPNRDWVDTHGFNFGAHQGAALFRVYSFEYTNVPEPAGVLLLIGGCLAGAVGRRTRK